jgi:hypothetical protein
MGTSLKLPLSASAFSGGYRSGRGMGTSLKLPLWPLFILKKIKKIIIIIIIIKFF